MKIIKDKIKNINWDTSNFYILCEKTKLKIDIIDGSVDIIIINSNSELVGIFYLEQNDIIKILYEKNDEEYIKPIKIYINTKYTFDSDTSNSDNI